MLNSIIRSPALLITLPLLTLIAASHQAHAEIYKWRDNRGVIQYSDRPPVANFTKITRNEMINALQTKDLCTVGPIQKTAPTARNLTAYFNWSVLGVPVSTAKAATNTTANTTASVINQYSPLVAKSAFNSGTKTVTVLAPSTPVVSAPKPTTTIPVTTAPVTPVKTPTTPVVTAPTTPVKTPTAPVTTPTATAPTTAAPAPTQVAVVSPPPATIPVTNTAANLIQVGLMPAVDISKNMVAAVGFNSLRVASTTEVAPSSLGEFRVSCAPSHMSNDDPLVYPNQQGAAHSHTFFGNTSVNYKSNLATLSTTGNSTCAGGIMNRSGYWVPSMIDTATNTPIFPNGGAIFYYKSGGLDGAIIQAPPKGLRMIAGNSKITSLDNASKHFSCTPGPNSKRQTWPWRETIPSGSDCEVGDTLEMGVTFPQCWDGKNLDSPNHQDHMAFTSHRPVAPPNDFYCPATHPIPLPEISVHVKFIITKANQSATWRLASDNYTTSTGGGLSAHADWVNGWDEVFMAGIIKNCINGKKDGHAHLLCDGRTFY